MANDAIWQVQKAVYGKLKADSTLMAMVSDVYEYVPSGATHPYISLANIDGKPWFTAGAKGEEISLGIEVFSSARGNKNIIDISARVISQLHDVSLTLTGHSLVNIRHLGTNTERLESGNIYVASLIFRIVTQED